ncbi:MAG: NAD-dependent epimerase/dehydratase family protein [Verrucomicrobiota bacterium]
MSLKVIRVFITGATGFVGGALARELAGRGADLHALARPGADRSPLADIKITWHEGDITVPERLKDTLAGADWIIHAAGPLGESGAPEEVYRQLHVGGTRNVMSAALAVGSVKRFLHVSSPGVLGPIPGDPASEDLPYAPTNPYERAKAGAEQVAREFTERGLPVVIARPEFIYGPGDRHVLRLFQAIQRGRFFYIEGGRHLCHPTFIADAVSGILLCLERGRTGETYHIAGPHPVTFRELCETIASALNVHSPSFSLPRWAAMLGASASEALGKIIGRKPPLSRAGVEFFTIDRRFSWQKARDELGYTPQFDLGAGTTSTVNWYREKRWL